MHLLREKSTFLGRGLCPFPDPTGTLPQLLVASQTASPASTTTSNKALDIALQHLPYNDMLTILTTSLARLRADWR